jgi:hypothetical protein
LRKRHIQRITYATLVATADPVTMSGMRRRVLGIVLIIAEPEPSVGYLVAGAALAIVGVLVVVPWWRRLVED